MLEAGSSKQRYEALDVVVDGTFVSATLLIHEVNFEDVKNYCYLEVIMIYKAIEFTYRVCSSTA